MLKLDGKGKSVEECCYVDLAHSISADSDIMTIQRFAARRGFPQKVYSDNGTNFRAASVELREPLPVRTYTY